jgi:hypothetical protein
MNPKHEFGGALLFLGIIFVLGVFPLLMYIFS